MLVDLPEAELRQYRSAQTDPADFDAFWEATLAESRAAAPAGAELVPVDAGLRTVDVWDVTFPGFAGQPIRAWLRVPRGATGPLPTVVQYQGYGGGRGLPTENLVYSAAGFAHLMVDTRGQGSGWSLGATADAGETGPQIPGVMTRGIDSRDTYYYRRLFTDAVRAVDAARTLDVVDPARIAVTGGSQGGGITLAVAGLVEGLTAVLPQVPFLCDFPRAVTIHDSDPYHELVRYLAQHRTKASAVLETLAYFDGVNFARRATAPAWFTVALMDEVCKPSTVFGAYNAYAGPKHIDVFPFNGHEGGGAQTDGDNVRILHEVFGD
ncbi:acetylxylan esterase [Protaetiibacter sp. SSC-01]|uniref:acetylxylan esterase n=1 Tax=Protaetiibacter sp. SSC-01 TaxID=2759943 RepID=UPI00165731D4|nr:acetylxylan esterase [Protaetiibacter sp. SSC-01]QNO36929.1 acetylxylan esterase [Protaetiibacter sp. SSC-01]